MQGSRELEPTSALVMEWARDLYTTGHAARFYSMLDLSSGQDLVAACEEICPWYREVILNRKWFIRRHVLELISSLDKPCRVIIPAAGRSPLALDLLDSCPERIVEVIETDIIGMEEKQDLYVHVAPHLAGRIRCVPADLCDQGMMAHVAGSVAPGYPELPCILVLEGISYYIPAEVLLGTISLFASGMNRNRVILEYLVPCRQVSEDRRYIPRGIWEVITCSCNLGETRTYSPDNMERIMRSAGCDLVRNFSLNEIERLKAGSNRYFPSQEAGWIQISTAEM